MHNNSSNVNNQTNNNYGRRHNGTILSYGNQDRYSNDTKFGDNHIDPHKKRLCHYCKNLPKSCSQLFYGQWLH